MTAVTIGNVIDAIGGFDAVGLPGDPGPVPAKVRKARRTPSDPCKDDPALAAAVKASCEAARNATLAALGVVDTDTPVEPPAVAPNTVVAAAPVSVPAPLKPRRAKAVALDASDWVLCALRMDKGGRRCVSATERVEGVLVVGPTGDVASLPMRDSLLRNGEGRRVIYNGIALDQGSYRNPFRGAPSLCTPRSIEFTCHNPACGHTWTESGDLGHRKIRKELPNLRCRFRKADGHWTGCGANGVTYRIVRTGLVDGPDPILAADDEIFDRMLEAWYAGPPKDGVPTLQLPRVWLVYPKGRAPVEYVPPADEPASISLCAAAETVTEMVGTDSTGAPRVRPRPLSIVPYELVAAYHRVGVLRGVSELKVARQAQADIIEAWFNAKTESVGWIRRDALYAREGAEWRVDLGGVPTAAYPTQRSKPRTPELYKLIK